MNLLDIRRHIVVAIASNDELFELLVLKGGNALDLIYLAGERGSLDIDYSMDGEISDVERCRELLLTLLREHFKELGYLLFDESFSVKPAGSEGHAWGGYVVLFKLIPITRAEALAMDRERIRRESTVSGPNQVRVFQVEISKNEFCQTATVAEVEGTPVRVYTPLMILAEKLRAICQQMPEYESRRHPAPRARDFFDICRMMDLEGDRFSLSDLAALVEPIFASKQVPLGLLARICETQSFHDSDWASVVTAVRGHVEEFAHYFERTVRLAEELRLAGIE